MILRQFAFGHMPRLGNEAVGMRDADAMQHETIVLTLRR